MAGLSEIISVQNQTGSTGIGFGDTGNGRDYLVQGFVPTLVNISAVAFYIVSKDANADIGYKIWIDRVDINSNPLGAVEVGIGGATEITNAQLVTGALTKYTLDSLVSVSPGTRYGLCVVPYNTTTNAKVSSYQDWHSSTANPYAGGRRVHLDGSYANPVAPDSGNADIRFEIYGYSDIASPHFFLRQGFQ